MITTYSSLHHVTGQVKVSQQRVANLAPCVPFNSLGGVVAVCGTSQSLFSSTVLTIINNAIEDNFDFDTRIYHKCVE